MADNAAAQDVPPAAAPPAEPKEAPKSNEQAKAKATVQQREEGLKLEVLSYARAHWGDLGMGFIACCLVIAAVSVIKPWVKLAFALVYERIELTRAGLADKTEDALIQTLPYVLGVPISYLLGFAGHFHSMTGVQLETPDALMLGGLATGAGSHFLYVIQRRWNILDSLEVRWQRLIGVSKEDLKAARTTRAHPPITDDMIEKHKRDKGEK